MNDFESFLNKMDSEVSFKPKKQQIFEEEKFNESYEEEEIVKDTFEEPAPEPVPEPKEEKSDEEIVEKILTFTSIYMKGIRENFPDKKHRLMVYKSLIDAINMATGNSIGSAVITTTIPKTEPIIITPPISILKSPGIV